MSPTTTRRDESVAVLALVKAQAATRDALTVQAVALAEASARSFTGWYDTAQITAWATGLAGRVEAVQRVLAQSTDAYLARILSLLTGGRFTPTGRVDVTGLRKGVTHAGAYGRAADAYRWQQSQLDAAARGILTEVSPTPPGLDDPLAKAVERVVAVADMDAQLAFQAQSRQVMTTAADKGLVTGYRRVIHPEASRGGSCGLCVVASDRLYHVEELLPLHNRCACTVLPVLDHADPGSGLNRADLNRIYEDAGGTGRAGLKHTQYQVDDHGELGPLLRPKGAKIRTARQAARDVNPAKAAKTAEQVRAEVERIRASLAPAEAKLKGLAAESADWDAFLKQVETRVADLDHQLVA
jgi:hypothetical protein